MNQVGAATRREYGIQKKESVQQWEKENIVGRVKRGMSFSLPPGVRQGARGKRDGGLMLSGWWDHRE